MFALKSYPLAIYISEYILQLLARLKFIPANYTISIHNASIYRSLLGTEKVQARICN